MDRFILAFTKRNVLGNLRMIHAVNATGLIQSVLTILRMCKLWSHTWGRVWEPTWAILFKNWRADKRIHRWSYKRRSGNGSPKIYIKKKDSHLNGINILTDARHGWRRNAVQSYFIAIWHNHHGVVGLAVVTRADDHVSQRHEMKGVEKL